MRDCKNCKHLIMYDYKNKSYSCESRECEFEPEEQESTTKNDLGVERHKQNIKAYAHDFGVSEEQAEMELRVTTKNNLGVDCISRKAAEDITWQDPSYTDPLNILTEVRDKIRELPSVTPQEPRWIPVSERLPEAIKNVLVTSVGGYVYISRLVHGEWEYGGEVVAWMPLPQPYKAETEVEDGKID